jgi:hypothetical protein
MPYIKPEDREQFKLGLELLSPTCAGELNYLFTKIAIHYFIDKGGAKYQHFNDIIGALEGCKLELYRRFIAPYEDKKIQENGDV